MPLKEAHMTENPARCAHLCGDCHQELAVVAKRMRLWCCGCHQAWTPACSLCSKIIRFCECGPDQKPCLILENVWPCECKAWNGYARTTCRNCEKPAPEWVLIRLGPFGFGEMLSQKHRQCPRCIAGFLSGYGATLTCEMCTRKWTRKCPLCQKRASACKCGSFQTLRWEPIIQQGVLLLPQIVPCKCGGWALVENVCRRCNARIPKLDPEGTGAKT